MKYTLYTHWSKELKRIIDRFPDLRLLIIGSSALEIEKGSHDLSRRAITRELFGLSLRESISLETGLSLPGYSLENILSDHSDIANQLVHQLSDHGEKIIALFEKYLLCGYYPYYQNYPERDDYYTTLKKMSTVPLKGICWLYKAN